MANEAERREGNPFSMRRGVALSRVDYGWPDLKPPTGAGWRAADLADFTAKETQALLGGAPGGPKAGPGGISAGRNLLLLRAERLLGIARLKGKSDPFKALAALSRAAAVVLQCRFERNAAALVSALESRGRRVRRFDPERGGAPPLYAGLSLDDPLLLLHLEHEWATAIAAARGGLALEEIGRFLARSGSAGAAEIARSLGVSPGAARSYLRWMEEVALVRREGRRYALGHALLALRFERAAARAAAGGGERASRAIAHPDDMSFD